MGQDLAASLLDLAYGHVLAQALAAIAALGVADVLADGGMRLEPLANETGVEAAPLGRVLRLLASYGIFAEQQGEIFVNTPRSALLAGEDSLRDAVVLAGHPIFWNPLGRLGDAMLTGRPSFDSLFGRAFFAYLEQDAGANAVFNAGMHRTSVAENASIVLSYEFGRFSSVIDVGGGRGGFLLEILRAHQNLKGILFDSPEVVEENCLLTGQLPSERYQVLSGNFFQAVPTSADAVLLKRVLHDWDDDQSVSILVNCRRSMRPGATLVVFEAVLEPGENSARRRVSDVLLLTILPGRERTQEDFRRIFARAGFSLTGIQPTESGLFAIEGTPVPGEGTFES